MTLDKPLNEKIAEYHNQNKQNDLSTLFIIMNNDAFYGGIMGAVYNVYNESRFERGREIDIEG